MDSTSPLDRREFVFADGHLDETAVPTTPSPRGKSSKGQITVLVDVAPSAGEGVADKLRSRLIALFYKDPSGSLTSTLRRSIQKLNDELFDENQKSMRSERQVAMVACAVIRDADLYLALAGGTTCYIGVANQITRLGRSDGAPTGLRPVMLGQEEEVVVEMFHRDATGLQILVMASSNAVDLSDERLDHSLLGDSDNMATLIRALAPRHAGPWPFRCLVASTAPPKTPEVAPPSLPPRAARRPARAVAATESPSLNVSVPRSSREPPLPIVPPLPPLSVTARRPKRPDDRPMTQNEVRRPPPLEEATELPNDWPDTQSPESGLLATIGAAFPRSIRLPAGWRSSSLRAVAILVLFSIGFFAVRFVAQVVRSNANYATALATVAQAQQQERDALAATDPSTRRQLLDAASQLAAQAYASQPGAAPVATAAARIQSEYQAATAAAVMSAPGRLIDLPTAGDRLVVNQDEIGVLDRTNSIVYLFLVNPDGNAAQSGTNPILVRKGDHVGSITVGDLLQLAWMPSTDALTTPSWMILDSGGFLIRYEPRRGLTLQTLPDDLNWSDVTQIGGSNGNLIALSAIHQTLSTYAPQLTGFVGPGANYLATSSVDLSDVAAFALDSQLFVLHQSGQVQSFTDGVADQLPTLPPDVAPVHPAGIALTGSSIYIGDPQRSRIVELSRAGVFQRALAGADPSVMANMRDLGVSVDGKSLYVLSGTAIYRFAVPPTP